MDWQFADWHDICTWENLVAGISLLMIVVAIYSIIQIECFLIKGTPDSLPFVIGKITDRNYEYFNSFASMITAVSVLLLKYDELRDIVILVVVLILLYSCYIKTNLFYSNPLFAGLGYKLAEINNSSHSSRLPEGSIIVYRGNITENSTIETYQLSKKIFIVKVVKS